VFETDDVKDFKKMANETISNRNRSADGSTLQWTNVHTFEYKSLNLTKYISDMTSRMIIILLK
jgi:hypothetical protein